MSTHKNPYAGRLGEFSGIAFDAAAASERKGVWREFFRGSMERGPERLVFEVGCSNAGFLASIAEANPDAAFVGIDWKFKVLFKGAKRVHGMGLKNVALLRGKAQEISRIFGEDELDEVWVFFPDPWAKKPQLKHRLIQEAFLLDCARVLKPGGRVFIKTDHPGYFQWMLALWGAPRPVLPAYDGPVPTERGMRAKQMLVRKPMDEDQLPNASAAVCARFEIVRQSIDYASLSAAELGTLFGGRDTLFEKGFREQKLPIYFLEVICTAKRSR
ncbi:MAG: methyltransferase domain-containing protein [Deltaproteobacteria bacterium]|nr:methyltransferase domain-containing protein [Deltaproteobacteria bacterium]